MTLGHLIFNFPIEVKRAVRKTHKILLKITVAKTAIIFNSILIFSDPRRGCYIVSHAFIFFFLFFFFFFLFFPPLLSRPYLWNRYSQRLQIECATWSCCLILHYSLPPNSLRYLFFFYFFIFFCHNFVAAISLEPSLVETPD